MSHGRRLWKCKGCKRQFSVKVGAIFEDSALPLGKWRGTDDFGRFEVLTSRVFGRRLTWKELVG